jgi:hypothetical protein
MGWFMITTAVRTFADSFTNKDEAFMQLLMSISDTRKRVAVLFLLSFLALC